MSFIVKDKDKLKYPKSFIEMCSHCGLNICYSLKDLSGYMINSENNKKGNYIYCPKCGERTIVLYCKQIFHCKDKKLKKYLDRNKLKYIYAGIDETTKENIFYYTVSENLLHLLRVWNCDNNKTFCFTEDVI
jgi:DNA-directed RNA polymerase subunit RPC12/RpoP